MNRGRRELVQLLAAVPALAQASQPYEPRFFTKLEFAQIDSLTDALIPTEPGSPGARSAQVGYYIDTVLLYAAKPMQEAWRTGLAAFRNLGLPPAQILEKAVQAEASPHSPEERFFVIFKRLTIEAFCHAENVQQEFLGYRGNRAIREFPGCSS